MKSSTSSPARKRCVMAMWLVALLGAGFDNAWAQAQTPAKEEPTLGWSNSTDLSLVLKDGNSEALTLGFANKLKYVWKDARFESEVSGLRSDTSDDRFFLVESGIQFPAGGAPSNPAKSLVKPSPTLDAENYLIRGGYEKNITQGFFWNTGISWDRNDDAGILNRYIAHAGVGNNWADSQRRRFATSYGVSYTDRELKELDPEKDRRFGGARLGWVHRALQCGNDVRQFVRDERQSLGWTRLLDLHHQRRVGVGQQQGRAQGEPAVAV